MKRLALEKSAIDFAYSNYAQADQLTLSKSVNAAFEAAQYNVADYGYWTTRVNSYLALFTRLAAQDAPSVVPTAPVAPAPTAPVAPDRPSNN